MRSPSTSSPTTLGAISILLSLSTVAKAASAPFADTVPPCWQNCMSEYVQPKCPSTTDTPCLCHFASTPSTSTPFLGCLHTFCGASSEPSISTPWKALQASCKDTKYPLPDSSIIIPSTSATDTTTTPPPSSPPSIPTATGGGSEVLKTATPSSSSANPSPSTGSSNNNSTASNVYDAAAEQSAIFNAISSMATASRTKSGGAAGATSTAGTGGGGGGKGTASAGAGGTMLDVYQSGAMGVRMGMGGLWGVLAVVGVGGMGI